MGWKIMPVNRLAHIQPTLESGDGANAGYELGNIRTADPNVGVDLDSTTGASAIEFDRGSATGLGVINGMAVINHELAAAD